MIKKYLLVYFLGLSIPLLLGLLIWQSNRYHDLNNDLVRLEQTQKEWIESNKKLVASIAEYSSAERIEIIAKNELELQKAAPEHFLQVKIIGGKGHEY